MKSVIIASLVASAAAFAPAQLGRGSSAVSLDISGELGAQAPLGAFDPLGIMDGGDQAQFDLYRETEIVHGRVAMLAVVGYLTTYAGVRFPGAEEVPSGFAALSWLQTTDQGHLIIPQMIATILLATIINRDASDTITNSGVKPAFPGDYRNGKLDFGWDKLSDEVKMKKRSIELNNGRAAQMGILGLMTHEAMGNISDILP